MFNLVSKHRNSIMGISAILILIHHYLTVIIGKPYKIGAIGVDIFMFTTGMGLYFSLYNSTKEKNLLKALPSYFIRRFKRIFPALATFLIAWAMWKHSNGGFTVKDYLLNLSLTGYWTLQYGKYFNWYISGILLFYVCSPVMFWTINKPSKKILSVSVCFLILSLLVFLMRKNENGEITRTLIMVVRLIPMLFGMFWGNYCKNPPSKKEKNIILTIFILLLICGIFLNYLNNAVWHDSGFTYGMPWYGFGLITPILCVLTAYIIDFISKYTALISSVFAFFGNISFEIYLTHIFIIEYIMPALMRKDNLWFKEPWNFCFSFFASTLFAYILNLFAKQISDKKSKYVLNT